MICTSPATTSLLLLLPTSTTLDFGRMGRRTRGGGFDGFSSSCARRILVSAARASSRSSSAADRVEIDRRLERREVVGRERPQAVALRDESPDLFRLLARDAVSLDL